MRPYYINEPGKKILDGTVKNIKQQYKEDLFAILLEEPPAEPGLHPSFEIISIQDHRLIVKINEGYRPNDILMYYLQKRCNYYRLL